MTPHPVAARSPVQGAVTGRGPAEKVKQANAADARSAIAGYPGLVGSMNLVSGR